MVYINIRQDAPAVYIPSNGWDFTLALLALEVRNTTDGRVLDLPHTEAVRAGFLVRLQLASLPEGFGVGEWEYSMVCMGHKIAGGLLVAVDGDNTAAPVEYESEQKVIQYGG